MKSLHFEPYANYINPRIFIYLCAFTKALQTFILHTKDLELYVISQRYVPYLFKLCQLVLFWVSIFFVTLFEAFDLMCRMLVVKYASNVIFNIKLFGYSNCLPPNTLCRGQDRMELSFRVVSAVICSRISWDTFQRCFIHTGIIKKYNRTSIR